MRNDERNDGRKQLLIFSCMAIFIFFCFRQLVSSLVLLVCVFVEEREGRIYSMCMSEIQDPYR